jgi:hypothetical protein
MRGLQRFQRVGAAAEEGTVNHTREGDFAAGFRVFQELKEFSSCKKTTSVRLRRIYRKSKCTITHVLYIVYTDYVCNSGSAPWNSGRRGRERERQSISDVMKRHICGGGGRKDVH